MPTWIVTHTEFLCNFLGPLAANFSAVQLQYALNFIEAVARRAHPITFRS